MKQSREWIIKGYQRCNQGGGMYSVCDGPVPDINELVPVVEKKALESESQKLKITRAALMTLGAVLVAMGIARPSVMKIIDDALEATQ